MSKYERLARLAKIMALLKAQRQAHQQKPTKKYGLSVKKNERDLENYTKVCNF